MIYYNPKSWLKLILSFNKSDTFKILWKGMVYIFLLSLLIAFVELKFFPQTEALEKLIAVYSLIGFVISLLLVFRTNTAYDRWWEGRKKWGEMVNNTRNFAVKIRTLVEYEEERKFYKKWIANFTIASKEHLRNGVRLEELELEPEEIVKFREIEHIPLAIVSKLYENTKKLKQKGAISEQEFIILDINLNEFMNIVGACERIKSTPIPYSYSLFFKKFIFIYVTTLPIAFVTQFGYYSALISTFVFYILVSLEVLAEEIEDPFGTDDNDLPTDQLCEKIKKNLNEVLDA